MEDLTGGVSFLGQTRDSQSVEKYLLHFEVSFTASFLARNLCSDLVQKVVRMWMRPKRLFLVYFVRM